MTYLRHLSLALLLLAIATVLYGSLAPSLAPPGGGVIDKFEHAGAYGVLSVLALLAFETRRRQIVALVFLFCLGIAIELMQGYLGGREASALDQAANTLGILLATSGYFWAMRRRFA
ncbi:VanZ family protein [Dongia rigui]|uniref:VanZ family protein n=1 Tax=Dongia rigui TaxID=940149 RepID=A0ABU5DZ78_9PROT|nr:VanZ family protein [Dongia rigui]MDY0872580.1 VanZ family protein [Dongia rigui]